MSTNIWMRPKLPLRVYVLYSKNTEQKGKLEVEKMQLKLGEDAVEKRSKLEEKRIEEERWGKKRAEKKRYFKENFKYGSTTVIKHNSQFFFWGDISHCGAENIFHNARKIKSIMEKNGMTIGHMSYNDPPSFFSDSTWEKEENERKTIYKDDLYKFVGDEIFVAELIGRAPIGHIYKDSLTNEDHDEQRDTEEKKEEILGL